MIVNKIFMYGLVRYRKKQLLFYLPQKLCHNKYTKMYTQMCCTNVIIKMLSWNRFVVTLVHVFLSLFVYFFLPIFEVLEKTGPAPELLRAHKTSLNSFNLFLEIYFNPVHINFTWTFHLMLSATTLSLEGSSYITGASSLSSDFRTLSYCFLSVSPF